MLLSTGRILAEGTPAAIKAQVSGRRISCVTTLPLAGISAWPEVVAARREGTATEIVATAAEPVVARLLAGDPRLSALEVGGAGLEEAFLALTAPAAEVAA